MNECCKNSILDNVEVSDDFLDYINDQFKSRYPSLIEKVNADINSKNRIDIIGPLLLSWYDDLMFQIDKWILTQTNDNLASCFFRVVGDIHEIKGRLFFHSNYHACTNLNNLIQMLKIQTEDNTNALQELEKGILYFWSSVTGIIQAQNINNVNFEKNFAKRFHYPTWSDNVPSKISIKNWNCIVINLLPWE